MNSPHHHRGVMRVAGLVLLLLALGSRESRSQASSYRAEMIATAALRPTSLAVSFPAGGWPRDLIAASRASDRAQGRTLMIVGGAAIVAGILVGDSGGTLLILGGVGVGAYGFYLYQR